MYHRILPDELIIHEPEDLQGICVSLSNFDQQMQYLSSEHHNCSIQELSDFQSKSNAVIVSFDDGYQDNYLYAYPILKKYNIPFVIYVSTKFVQGKAIIWWRDLAQSFEHLKTVSFSWEGKTCNYQINSKQEKKNAWNEIIELFQSASSMSDIKNALYEIRGEGCIVNNDDLFLSWSEIYELDKDELVTIGAHTHEHLPLRRLEKDDVIFQITESIKILESKVGHSIKHFSYPFGTKNEVSIRDMKLVKECELTEEEAVELINISPQSLPELRSFTFGWKKLILAENLEKILRIIKEIS